MHLVAFLTLASVLGGANPEANCLPSERGKFVAPNGRVTLALGEYDEVREEHSLILEVDDGEKREIYRFGRSVCIVWNPAGDRFALTDNFGSNSSMTYLVKLALPEARMNLEPFLPSMVRGYLRGSSHGYVEALRWDLTGLEVLVTGDSFEINKGFEIRVKCLANGEGYDCIASGGEG